MRTLNVAKAEKTAFWVVEKKNKLLADAIMFTSLIIKGHVLTHTLTMLLQQHAKLWYGCR